MSKPLCIQAPGDPKIYKVQGTNRIPYHSWAEYVADGHLPVTRVTSAELDGYTLVSHFTEEFEHLKKAVSCKSRITKWAIPQFPDKEDLLAASLAACRGELYLEFGVLTGQTVNIIAAQISGAVYGFDSFEGLPENWGPGFRQGHFKTSARPAVLPNVHLVEGWFDEVLPGFLDEHPGQVAFAHIDSDVYSSARYVLGALADAGRLGKGTVIQFDEMFAVKDDLWYCGEYDAFTEFVKKYKLEYEWLGYAEEAAALRVEALST